MELKRRTPGETIAYKEGYLAALNWTYRKMSKGTFPSVLLEEIIIFRSQLEDPHGKRLEKGT